MHNVERSVDRISTLLFFAGDIVDVFVLPPCVEKEGKGIRSASIVVGLKTQGKTSLMLNGFALSTRLDSDKN